MRSRSWFVVLALVLGCGPGSSSHPEIAWHEGDVAAAFERARAEQKPLFLYWGAIWCPPCNQIKTTIFNRPAFIEKTRSFVPVYLDGDTESAQTWGDRFEVLGYPTMLVFDPQGNEVTRIPGGIDIEAFASVLDVALNRMRPVRQVLEAVLAGDPDVTDDDYRLLAYHSWGQTQDIGIPAEQQVEAFRALAGRVPQELAAERSRLFFHYLSRALEVQALAEEERAESAARVRAILADPLLVRANLDTLEYQAGDVVSGLLPGDTEERRELIARWRAAMESVREDSALSINERLASWFPAIEFWRIEHEADPEAPLSPELLAEIRETVAWADRATTDEHERLSTMNTAAHVLEDAGLPEEVRALALAEVDRSAAPYYFMAWLSDLAEKAGRPDEAIDWLRKAHDASTGRATRFQWGLNYVVGLMELRPDDAETIRNETIRVLTELVELDDAFDGRNKGRLRDLEQKLAEWNAQGTHAREIDAIRSTVRSSCASFDDEARQRCGDFLSQG